MEDNNVEDPLAEISGLLGKTLQYVTEDYESSEPAKPATESSNSPGTAEKQEEQGMQLLGSSYEPQVPGSSTADHPAADIDINLLDEPVAAVPSGASDSLHRTHPQDMHTAPSNASSIHAALPGPSVAGPSAAPSNASQNGSAAPSIYVEIREPEKVETVSSLGLKTHYVRYTVVTKSTLPNFIADAEVQRRFSDFDSLHKYLRQEYRGLIVPPLPEKSFLQGKIAQDEFINLRRADLQGFMRMIVRHPQLKDAEAVKIFLLQPGELMRNPAWTYLIHPPPGYAPSPSAASMSSALSSLMPPGSSSDTSGALGAVKGQLGSLMTWVKASVAQLGPVKRELADDELALRQAKELLLDLQRLLELSTESARALCTHMDALGEDVRLLGKHFATLARFEEAMQSKVGQYTVQGASAGNRAADLNRVAYSIVKHNPMFKSLSVKTAASLVPLHDYLTLVPEAIAALEVRESALNLLFTLQDELASKQAQLEQASKNPLDKRTAQLQAAVAALEEQIRGSQGDYDRVKSRNQMELARLGLEREADFREMLSGFARTQAALMQASADAWTTLSRQFESPGGDATPTMGAAAGEGP